MKTTVKASVLADRLYNCPADLDCGPCRRLIGDLIAVAEAARKLVQNFQNQNEWDEHEDLRAALAALDARLADA